MTYPTWDNPSIVALQRIHSKKVLPPMRPIILAGENGASIVTAISGRLLSIVTYPQLSMTRPQVVDINGDGTSELLEISNDAIWGYVVSVQTRASVSFQILVGLLLMGMMLAVLQNHFGQHPVRRSTDF